MKSWDLIRLRRFLEWSAADVLAWRLTWSDNVIWWRQMTTAAVFRRVLSPLARDGDAKNLGGAWRRVRRHMTTRFSGQVDRWTTRPSWRRVWLRSSPGVENLRRACENSRSHCPRVVAHATAVGGRVSGFLLREVVEHVCGVGFIRRSRYLHKSEELRHGFAWVCWILTQHRAMVAARCHGVKIQQKSMCDFWWWCACDIILCLLEMFVWCQERSLALIPC